MAKDKQSDKSGGKRPIPVIAVVLVAVLLGGFAGAGIIAPKLVPSDPNGHASETEGGSNSHLPQEEHHPRGVIFQIEDIILNPAGSEGTHFLMATVVLEVPTSEEEHHLREQDVRVRDRVLSILESKTMEMLSMPGARDSLKQELAREIWPMTGGAEWLAVYIPEFVIQ